MLKKYLKDSGRKTQSQISYFKLSHTIEQFTGRVKKTAIYAFHTPSLIGRPFKIFPRSKSRDTVESHECERKNFRFETQVYINNSSDTVP
jgi:hypothetical protein